MMTKRARIFSHGGSQAVRLPAEFRFTDIDAVYVRRNVAGDVVLSRHAPQPYSTFMATRKSLGVLPDTFLSPTERDQRTEDRDPFADFSDGRPER